MLKDIFGRFLGHDENGPALVALMGLSVSGLVFYISLQGPMISSSSADNVLTEFSGRGIGRFSSAASSSRDGQHVYGRNRSSSHDGTLR